MYQVGESLTLEFLFYILGAGETSAPQPEATTAGIVMQASSLQSQAGKPDVRGTMYTRLQTISGQQRCSDQARIVPKRREQQADMTILFRQGTSDAFQQQLSNGRYAAAKNETFRVKGKLKGNQSFGQVATKSFNNILRKLVTTSRSVKDNRSRETWMTGQF